MCRGVSLAVGFFEFFSLLLTRVAPPHHPHTPGVDVHCIGTDSLLEGERGQALFFFAFKGNHCDERLVVIYCDAALPAELLS